MSEVRLIDANALKEEVNKKKVVGRFNTLLLIDNAPTVDVKFELKTENGITYPKALEHMTFTHTLSIEERQNIIEAYMLGANSNIRPQGEWKHIVEEDNDVECPFCGFQEDGIYYNFCPNCGADMRKDGAENE